MKNSTFMICYQHNTVFNDELGTVKDLKMKLYIKENSTPKFFKVHTLPLTKFWMNSTSQSKWYYYSC